MAKWWDYNKYEIVLGITAIIVVGSRVCFFTSLIDKKGISDLFDFLTLACAIILIMFTPKVSKGLLKLIFIAIAIFGIALFIMQYEDKNTAMSIIISIILVLITYSIGKGQIETQKKLAEDNDKLQKIIAENTNQMLQKLADDSHKLQKKVADDNINISLFDLRVDIYKKLTKVIDDIKNLFYFIHEGGSIEIESIYSYMRELRILAISSRYMLNEELSNLIVEIDNYYKIHTDILVDFFLSQKYLKEDINTFQSELNNLINVLEKDLEQNKECYLKHVKLRLGDMDIINIKNNIKEHTLFQESKEILTNNYITTKNLLWDINNELTELEKNFLQKYDVFMSANTPKIDIDEKNS